jgi:hypothetical protein
MEEHDNFALLKAASRLVMFETETPNYEIATSGGTLFLVLYEGRPYGITAKHNKHSFEWKDLLVTDTKFGKNSAGLAAVHYAAKPTLSAIGSDIMDVAVVTFPDDITQDFFQSTAYDLSKPSISKSNIGDRLAFYGAISDLLWLDDKQIFARFAQLQLEDSGCYPSDPVLRSAEGKWDNISFSSMAGISGGPVYNFAKGGICGMAVRGGLERSGHAKAYYIDFQDICHLLQCIHSGELESHYTKNVEQ